MKPLLTLALLLSIQHLYAQTAVSTSAGATSAVSTSAVSTSAVSTSAVSTSAVSTSAVSTSAVSTSATPKRTAPQSADQKAVSHAERRRFDAQIKKDYAVLEQVLSDDLIYTHSNGPVDNKTAYIQSIRAGKLTYEAIDVLEETIRIYGNTAVVNGLCLIRAASNGEPINTRLRYTDVYVRNGTQWQMVAYQSLRLAN